MTNTENQQLKSKKSHPRPYIKDMERLKKAGFKIKVRHDRNFIRPIVIPVVATNTSFSMKLFENIIMTKGEMKQKPYNNECEIQNYGGQTTVSIFKDEQLVSQGVAKVHKNDHFVRHIGLHVAFGRALKSLNQTI